MTNNIYPPTDNNSLVSQEKHHLEAELFFSTQPLYFWSNKCYERNAIFSKYNTMSKCFCTHYHEIIQKAI